MGGEGDTSLISARSSSLVGGGWGLSSRDRNFIITFILDYVQLLLLAFFIVINKVARCFMCPSQMTE